MLVICSVFAAFAGVVLVSMNGYATAADGDVFLLPVLAAVILGGASLRGGRGSVVATLIGPPHLRDRRERPEHPERRSRS